MGIPFLLLYADIFLTLPIGVDQTGLDTRNPNEDKRSLNNLVFEYRRPYGIIWIPLDKAQFEFQSNRTRRPVY